MSFGKDLNKQFITETRAIKTGSINEQALFTALDKAFDKHSHIHTALCQVIHGARHFVSFDEKPKTDAYYKGDHGKTVKCELADLLIVSVNRHEMRICCLQNKYEKNRAGMRIADDFKADMRQLYLLKERPDFVKSGKDSSLLKDAICPSVGAYGVFYPDGKDFNMNYYSAKILEFINPSAQGRVRHIRKSAAEPKSATYMSGTVKEQQYSDCIVDFGDALENMLVGTPLPIYDGLLALQDIQILDAVSRVLSDISPRLELDGIREAIQYRVPLVSYRTAVVIKGLE